MDCQELFKSCLGRKLCHTRNHKGTRTNRLLSESQKPIKDIPLACRLMLRLFGRRSALSSPVLMKMVGRLEKVSGASMLFTISMASRFTLAKLLRDLAAESAVT